MATQNMLDVVFDEAQENITKAVTGEINEQVNRSMEQVGKTLSALVDKQS